MMPVVGNCRAEVLSCLRPVAEGAASIGRVRVIINVEKHPCARPPQASNRAVCDQARPLMRFSRCHPSMEAGGSVLRQVGLAEVFTAERARELLAVLDCLVQASRSRADLSIAGEYASDRDPSSCAAGTDLARPSINPARAAAGANRAYENARSKVPTHASPDRIADELGRASIKISRARHNRNCIAGNIECIRSGY